MKTRWDGRSPNPHLYAPYRRTIKGNPALEAANKIGRRRARLSLRRLLPRLSFRGGPGKWL